MKTYSFRHIKNIAVVLFVMATLLFFWRMERQTQIRRRISNTCFRQQHYYNLLVGNDTVCPFPYLTDAMRFVSDDSLRIDSLVRMYGEQQSELNYYLSVHNVQDEGYNMIADYATMIDTKADSTRRLLHYIIKIDSGEKHQLVHEAKYYSCRPHRVRTDMKGDSAGVYIGEMDSLRRADGHGVYKAYDGSYYQGEWKEGHRHGFGFAIGPWKRLRVGEWSEDSYLGERVRYTSNRIYGIDISRYQHEQGKKKYAINWGQMRITHLGSMSRKQITGTVDYPVSFVYIKSTEGATIRNKYFNSDYVNARRRGIRVGAYHFFSVRSSGVAQANYFIKNTRFNRGDFPPVLDVEPSAKQIREMGGTSVMFARIRSWMSIVEKHTGVRPILYVSQTFVNRYLSEAPDIKKNYRIWIARYGEYKPDIRLAIWQLSPDGRVSGIHGAVDINVFNGYGDLYDEFLQNALIP